MAETYRESVWIYMLGHPITRRAGWDTSTVKIPRLLTYIEYVQALIAEDQPVPVAQTVVAHRTLYNDASGRPPQVLYIEEGVDPLLAFRAYEIAQLLAWWAL
jgi:hypothetical protein